MLCNWLSLRRLVWWINHLPPACWSTFWKSIFKQQLGSRFDIMDSISSNFFCILTYAIIYVLVHHIIYRLIFTSWIFLIFSSTPLLTSCINIIFVLSIGYLKEEVRCISPKHIIITDCKSIYDNYQLTPQSEMAGRRCEFPVLLSQTFIIYSLGKMDLVIFHPDNMVLANDTYIYI